MKFSIKLLLIILTTGMAVLILLSFATYKLNYNSIIKSQSIYTESITKEVSGNINQLLNEKVKTTLTLANTPIIMKGLETSNLAYANLSDEKRIESIKLLNEKWKSTKDPTDNFILKFTDNVVSLFLKNQQATLKDEYGEIFLTNKFGALVASTSKLSTFAHGHKYWWLSSYNNGKGAVFFDDRGYDDSVRGYVLGLVVPIKKGTEIIGILKCNLNILGNINQLVSDAENKLIGKFKLIRSGGMVVFEEGFEPLSTQIHDSIYKKLKRKNTESFIINDSGEKYLVGFSEIKMTKGGKGYGFGGTFESIDHKKGNTGESWYVICYRQMSIVRSPITESIKSIILIGATIIMILVFVSFLFGRKIAKPLAILDKATEKIGKGNFEYRIEMKRNDEFGNLAHSFNNMVSMLQQTTTSIELLRESEKKYKSVVENANDVITVAQGEMFKFVNRKLIEVTGYSKEELMPMPFLNIVHPDDHHLVKQKYQERLKNKKKSESYELRIITKNKTVKWLESKAVIITWEGEPATLDLLTDITKRKKDEKVLKESKEILDKFMNSATDGFVLLDSKLNHIEMNKTALEMTGLKRKNVIGKSIVDTVPNIKGTDRYDEYIKVMKTGKPFHDVIAAYPLTNDKHINFKAFKVGDGIGFILTDITGQKQAEKKLRENEEKFRNYVETSQDLIWECDDKGRFIYLNPAWEKDTGYKINEMLGKPFTDFALKGDDEKISAEFAKHLEGGFVKGFPSTYISKDGFEIALVFNAIPTYDSNQNIIGTQGSAYNVTEINSAKVELDKIFSLSPDMICKANVNGYFKKLNPAWEDILGFTIEELVSEPFNNFIHPDDQKLTLKDIGKQVGGKSTIKFENRYRCKDGSYKSLEWNATPVSTDGVLYAVARDITERKRIDEILKKNHEHLEAKVKERTGELQEMNTALKVLLNERDNDRKELEEKLFANYKLLLSPFLQKLKSSLTKKNQQNLMKIVESNLKELLQPFSQKLSNPMVNLTPAEVKVASLIKQGLSNKEIANILNISVRTVTKHREHIRKKLGLKNNKVNLCNYLSNF